jgi:D-beta-D-heptose 7-phosphate kinase/D-beta-D-heptose 1-phosphate adenosyltransferase
MGQVFANSKDLSRELDRMRNQRPEGRKVVFTNGCFDILHLGHVRYLKEARALGDYLVVGLNSDQSVKGLKGPTRPVQSEDARAEILAALSCVDAVAIFSEPTAENLIREVKPDIYVKGGDYTVDTIIEAPIVLSYGGVVKVLKFTQGFSTSSIIEKMKS